ncbi:MAG: MurR/RpiR family transcriptional regulator [Clostridia bacterium]|nr:MurR/RpiR family transcriptional regulator [Lachnospiraceae bacterium]NCC00097.1 MurR/RpiR family transcriptional regulator [Clostridia bacterium]NCD01640.1 MurR/RpiR family transcriptional regulator [Clostridia bacterium]
MSDFLTNLSQHFDSFTHSQKRTANYLTDHMSDFAFSTLESLAEKINVSTTTIIRFARALGYKGFSEMQRDIQAELKHRESLPGRLEDMPSISDNHLLRESIENDIKNIKKTLDVQKDEDLKKAIEIISGARHIYVLGMRSSFAVAHYMASQLGEIKKHVNLIQSIGMIYPEEIVGAGEDDVCIAYLFPRYSKVAATMISWLKEHGVKIILITSLNYGAVSGYGDIMLPCAISSVSYKNSFAAPLCLTNYLIAALAKQNYDEAKEVLSRTESILSQGYYLGI